MNLNVNVNAGTLKEANEIANMLDEKYGKRIRVTIEDNSNKVREEALDHLNIRWFIEDIERAIIDSGHKATDENINMVCKEINRGFEESVTEDINERLNELASMMLN